MHSWLNAHLPIPIGVENPSLTKAGLLPVRNTDNAWRVYAMKPPAEKPELGLPEFQIAKGTRMFRRGNHWHDCKSDIPEHYDELEPLPITALREAEEEIGLPYTYIEKWFNIGEVEFRSATKQKRKAMQLYAAFLNTPLADTPNARWLTPDEAAKHMREDHFAIVQSVIETLSKHSKL